MAGDDNECPIIAGTWKASGKNYKLFTDLENRANGVNPIGGQPQFKANANGFQFPKLQYTKFSGMETWEVTQDTDLGCDWHATKYYEEKVVCDESPNPNYNNVNACGGATLLKPSTSCQTDNKGEPTKKPQINEQTCYTCTLTDDTPHKYGECTFYVYDALAGTMSSMPMNHDKKGSWKWSAMDTAFTRYRGVINEDGLTVLDTYSVQTDPGDAMSKGMLPAQQLFTKTTEQKLPSLSFDTADFSFLLGCLAILWLLIISIVFGIKLGPKTERLAAEQEEARRIEAERIAAAEEEARQAARF